MELGGIPQPVSLPLTPQQCLAAGLKLANPPKDDVVTDGNVNPSGGESSHAGDTKGSTADLG